MSVFYMDTSAIAKHYVAEIGSKWVHSLTDPVSGHSIIVSELTIVEFSSVLARRQREKTLSSHDAGLYETQYLYDYKSHYTPVLLSTNIVVQASQLTKRHILRTLDAMHLASALETARISGASLTFVCSDKHLLTAAVGEGLLTDDPLNHP
jgi:predicted nucleic acid-binding protein